jgi:hypothetical protein
MTIAVQVGGAWKEGTPDKVNIGGAWKPVTSAKVNIGGVWKDIYLVPAAGGPLSNILWRKTGNSREFEFTAVGGSGTYYWDWDGPSTSNEGGGYGGNVMVHAYKSYGTKEVVCQDLGTAEHPEFGGVTYSITVTA